MVLADNSEDGINGDYPPSRWEAQIDAISLLLASKYQGMNDNAAGLATMAGKAVEVLCTPTQDGNKVSSTLFGAKIGGHVHLINALQISILALKNRANPKTKQRIILFIGSKISENSDILRVIGKKLSKNAIAITIFAFGDTSTQQKDKLETLTNSVNSEDNSQLHWIDRGRTITDMLVSSALFRDDGGKPFKAGGDDADLDPELAEAIRKSLQQAEAANAAKAVIQSVTGADKSGQDQKSMKPIQMEVEKEDKDDLDDEQAERLAKQLSLQEQARQRETRVKDVMEDEGKDQKDDKKKKDQERETVASERQEGSEAQKGEGNQLEFLGEKHIHLPKDSKTEKFRRQLDDLAEDVQDDDKDKDKKKQGKKDKKGHHTEKHHSERHDKKHEDANK